MQRASGEILREHLHTVDTHGLISRRELIRRAGVLGVGATLAGFSGLLAACGESSGSGRVTIGMDSGAYTPVFKEFAPDIKRVTGVEAELASYPLENMYDQNLLALRQPTARFDAFDFWPNFAGDFGPFLAPLSEVGDLKQLNIDNIEPVFQLLNRYNGKQVAVMMDGDMFINTYRTDLFGDAKEQRDFNAKYGYELKPPTTYEQYRDTAEFFTRPAEDLYGAVEVTSFFVYAFFANQFVQLGAERGVNYGEYFDEDMRPLINEDLGVEAMERYKAMTEYMPTKLASALPWDKGRELFFGGRFAQANWWTDMPKGASNSEISDVSEKISVSPNWGQVTMLPYGRAMGIAGNSENPEAAFKVLAFIQQSRNANRWVAETFAQSLIDPWQKSMFDDPAETFPLQAQAGFAKEFAGVNSEMLNREKAYPDISIPGTAQYLDAQVRRVQEAVTGQKSPKAALDAMAADFEKTTEDLGRDRQIKHYKQYRDMMVEEGYWSAS